MLYAKKTTPQNGGRHFKASRADHGTKVAIIQNNRDKYSVSAMCYVLQIARSTFYYEAKEQATEDDVTEVVVDIFHKKRKAYGMRKIKVKLHERGFVVSRRRIGRIMKEHGLVSTYTVAQYKPYKTACNEAATANTLNREFTQMESKRFVVSDLAYVKVQNQWHYICVLVDLFNREIIGHSAGPRKDAALVARAFATVEGDLRDIQWFHTDRGSEFKNQSMDELLKTFHIGRSLSMKGCPYDNAVAEATFKVMKTEFVYQMNFQSLRHLELELFDYVNWYNHHRIHGTLEFMTSVHYRHAALKKVV
ncbi:IS3 family transposase [Paenibacillus sp. 1-18]|uniref:IS3 family transposase n=1 Tax=Paenibacillus sp. 1-18 TaxID=1333846 RepID=UPI0004B2CAA8